MYIYFFPKVLLVEQILLRQIPLNLATVQEDGKLKVDTLLLKEKEITIPLDTSKPFKLNYDSTGVCKFRHSRIFALT